jgi:two-component system chemotaxis response regulator CheB
MPVRLLVVDDSEVIRLLFTKAIERDPELRVVASTGDGIEAIARAREHQPDVILLDIEMPRMDGLTALPEIQKASPKSVIIIISGNSETSVREALHSVGQGAVDFIIKPSADDTQGGKAFYEQLRHTIRALAPSERLTAPTPATSRLPLPKEGGNTKLAPKPIYSTLQPSVPARKSDTSGKITLRPAIGVRRIKALAIASSTGGPDALLKLFPQIGQRLAHIPIFITQHMPAAFTAPLAEQISHYGSCECREARDGEIIAPGRVYVAPGGHHMTVQGTPEAARIRLLQTPPVNSCRPSADPMLTTLAETFGHHLLALVLTGIGNDGCAGARAVVEHGGSVIAQDKESSAVYGMPRMVAEAGLCEEILPLSAIADALVARAPRL